HGKIIPLSVNMLRWNQTPARQGEVHMTRTRLISAFLVTAMFTWGCATKRGTGALIGAGSGAALGAGIGALAGGGKGALIGGAAGAVVGTATGAVIGNYMDK